MQQAYGNAPVRLLTECRQTSSQQVICLACLQRELWREMTEIIYPSGVFQQQCGHNLIRKSGLLHVMYMYMFM
jgi:hypothetical protein